VIPRRYRALLADRGARRLLSGLGVSSLGDGMSTVTIAWLAVRTAPAGKVGLFVGLDALPVYVAHDLHAHAGLLGAYWTSFGVGAFVSTLLAGTLRSRATRRITLLIVAGWGACLVPFAFAPAGPTLVCFAAGGVVYGPFIPLTYALFQSITTTANLPSVLAARSAALIVAAPLGMAIGGPIVAGLGARWTLTASGAATVLLAALATALWRPSHSWRSALPPLRARFQTR
jgi:predicted MFS family arabinose efflux permease